MTATVTVTRPRRTAVTVVLAAVAPTVALVAGCAADSSAPQDPAIDRETTTTPTTPTTTRLPSRSAAEPTKDMTMQILITIGDQQLAATLEDSAAVRDLAAQLPVTIDMVDHGGVEKTGPLPSPLSTQGQPEGADPDVGAVGYYAPGNDLVLYYGDQSFFPGIVVLGRLEGDAASRVALLDGPVTATVEAR